MSIQFTDHSDAVKAQLDKNTKAALLVIGQKGVELTLGQMESGYGKPIRQTGDLMRDVHFEVRWENAVENRRKSVQPDTRPINCRVRGFSEWNTCWGVPSSTICPPSIKTTRSATSRAKLIS